jgi:hypothetical protein
MPEKKLDSPNLPTPDPRWNDDPFQNPPEVKAAWREAVRRQKADRKSRAIMPTKATPKAKPKKSQKERFIEFAKEVGADDDGKALERTFGKAVPPKKPKR